jgi:predicted amidophosphoribosyltransferase
MSIKNCPECGTLHTEKGVLCSNCGAKAETEFKKVAVFVRSNPGKQAEEISVATDVPIKKILEYLSAGRLQVAKPVAFLRCANCKTPITTGKYCEECALLMDSRSLKRLKKTGALHPEKNRRRDALPRLKRTIK